MKHKLFKLANLSYYSSFLNIFFSYKLIKLFNDKQDSYTEYLNINKN